MSSTGTKGGISTAHTVAVTPIRPAPTRTASVTGLASTQGLLWSGPSGRPHLSRCSRLSRWSSDRKPAVASRKGTSPGPVWTSPAGTE